VSQLQALPCQLSESGLMFGEGSSAGARYSRRFTDRQGFIVNPTSVHDADAVFMMVKEAIETQNKTTLFSKPNSGFHAVMFLTQVPAHLMSLSC
jgi:hypothetical protein